VVILMGVAVMDIAMEEHRRRRQQLRKY